MFHRETLNVGNLFAQLLVNLTAYLYLRWLPLTTTVVIRL